MHRPRVIFRHRADNKLNQRARNSKPIADNW
jgi:hypothetical protein